jgi:cytochrome c oxidase subunit 3
VAHAKHHDYHILQPSVWPLLTSLSTLAAALGLVFWLHQSISAWLFGAGLIAVIACVIAWWVDVVDEAEHKGDHTPVVQLHHRYGMALFIASEVMFFVAWFWAFFDASFFPYDIIRAIGDTPIDKAQLGDIKQYTRLEATGGIWPPKGIEVFNAWRLPLLNTLILLLSGCTLTYGHHALLHNDRKGLNLGLFFTIVLGLVFTALQVFEYMHAPFAFKESIYGATFFLATGFHGFHVVVGTIFLIVCYIRSLKGHFKPNHHFGLEAAAWYWHFVDVVWLFLFVTVYIWGNAGGVVAGH